MVSEGPLCNDTSNWDDDCKKKCGGNNNEFCGVLNKRCIVYEAGTAGEFNKNSPFLKKKTLFRFYGVEI